MRVLTGALAAGAALLLTAGGARAEPISLTLNSSDPGFSQPAGSNFSSSAFVLDLGTLNMTGNTAATIKIDGFAPGQNYTVVFDVAGNSTSNAWTSLTAEILDPLSDGHDAMDPVQPDYVPAGYSTSNNTDGISFAWNSGLERSATFAGGGAASLFIDENTNMRDMLGFNGFTGGQVAHVTFGLRDNSPNGAFLLRLSTSGASDLLPTPEPASMILLGTGLFGAALARRRRTAR
jgi:hypothetical protein